jgi:hypothetical protein
MGYFDSNDSLYGSINEIKEYNPYSKDLNYKLDIIGNLYNNTTYLEKSIFRIDSGLHIEKDESARKKRQESSIPISIGGSSPSEETSLTPRTLIGKGEEKIEISVKTPPEYTQVQRAIATMRRSLDNVVSETSSPTSPEYGARVRDLSDRLEKFTRLVDVQVALFSVPPSYELEKGINTEKVTLSTESLGEYDALRREWMEICGIGLPELSKEYSSAGSVPVSIVARKELQNIMGKMQFYDHFLSSIAGERGRKIRELLIQVKTDTVRLYTIGSDINIANVIDPLLTALEGGQERIKVGTDDRMTEEEIETAKRIIRNYKALNDLAKEEISDSEKKTNSNSV